MCSDDPLIGGNIQRSDNVTKTGPQTKDMRRGEKGASASKLNLDQ